MSRLQAVKLPCSGWRTTRSGARTSDAVVLGVLFMDKLIRKFDIVEESPFCFCDGKFR